jgi:hypothetical protein
MKLLILEYPEKTRNNLYPSIGKFESRLKKEEETRKKLKLFSELLLVQIS